MLVFQALTLRQSESRDYRLYVVHCIRSFLIEKSNFGAEAGLGLNVVGFLAISD